jgi:hypothetical protein
LRAQLDRLFVEIDLPKVVSTGNEFALRVQILRLPLAGLKFHRTYGLPGTHTLMVKSTLPEELPMSEYSSENVNEYVEGKIDEAELGCTAEANVRDFVKIFSDYKNLETPVVDVSHEDEKTRRTRIANKIYRNACTKSGLDHCFFKNFATWSEYVNGMIDEDAFIEDAIFEVMKMKKNAEAEKL